MKKERQFDSSKHMFPLRWNVGPKTKSNTINVRKEKTLKRFSVKWKKSFRKNKKNRGSLNQVNKYFLQV